MPRISLRGLVVALSLAIGFAPACSKPKNEEVPVTPGGSGAPVMKPADGSAAPKPDASAPAEPPSRLAELAEVATSAFSIDKLKSMASSLSTDDLRNVAGKLASSIQTQSGTFEIMKGKLAKLSPTDLGSMADMKKTLENSENLLKELRGKLAVVVDALKAKGVDVSQYTAFLAGN